MPEDIKMTLILGRPFLSTAHAKIDVFKRKITLRVGEEKIIFKSIKPASSLVKMVYMLSLRERMELDLEARLMGKTLVLNRSLDPFNEDYIELNDLNVPLELKKDQVDDLMPTIKEGEAIEEFRARNDARMICLGVNFEPDEWIKDSGCSKHVTGNRKLFSTYKAYNGGNVIFGSNLHGNIIGKGQICDNKCRVTFSEHDSEITKDGKVIELLHMDLFGPSVVRCYGGNRYTLVIVDDYSSAFYVSEDTLNHFKVRGFGSLLEAGIKADTKHDIGPTCR
nr:retrotransposon protein [Tanacetum cinerariifolium]